MSWQVSLDFSFLQAKVNRFKTFVRIQPFNYYYFQFSNLQDEKKETPRVQVIVGICAMEKKSLSKPMTEILSRMGEFEYIKTVIFPEDTIVNVSSEKMPLMSHFEQLE